MNDAEQRAAAKQFAQDWQARGDEKQDNQSFWLALLQKVFGVAEPEKYINFEYPVLVDDGRKEKGTTKFIDGYIAKTRVLIEQKGRGIDLTIGYRQSDESFLTPYQQARRYGGYLPQLEQPRWIIVSNFDEFDIHDMNRPNDSPEIVKLCDLEKEYHRLQFLVDTTSEHIKKEMEISLKAGELVGVLYDALLAQYQNPNDPETLKSLNALCVRLVFCLYAEDAGIFGKHLMFHDYLKSHERDARRALIDLFRVLDQKPENRDPYMDEDLAAFPYVNGGLFSDENIIIPRLTEKIVSLILREASENFDWSDISPTIFGAVFESTLNPETRRSGGMHYTSIENIHKVIDPLFLNDLRAELAEIQQTPVVRTRRSRLEAFQEKLAGLTFLDPACGSGNFLTETYLSLRRMENEIVRSLIDAREGRTKDQRDQITAGQIMWGITDSTVLEPIKVSIQQFYGIEINDFAATVAKTALWIAESQMMKQTEEIVHMPLDFLPLKSYVNIFEGNALRVDWESVVPKERLNYIMGNPPFVGYSLQSKEQKADILAIYVDEKGKPYKTAGKIDYVAGWYFKAAQLMQDTDIRTAFVSTNSITQGEQVAGVWKPLYERFGVHIDFAHRTFRWDSEASLKAQVHCVIVGFSVAPFTGEKWLFTSERAQSVENINPYLMDAPNIFVESRTTALCDVPKMSSGGKPVEGGYYIFTDEEKDSFLIKEPKAINLIKRYVGSDDFINGYNRWCLWLKGCSPKELRNLPECMRRIELVREYRLNSTKAATRACAETPTLFMEIKQPEGNFLIVPEVSSERRRYVPIGYADTEMICSNKVRYVPNASLYHFGVLTSNIHMAWMRTVCGRLKSDYSYSVNIVYNNFPWPTPTDEQRAKIKQTAQAILDARNLYPNDSLADLYDERTMPPELRRAHQQNDKAVMQAYGFSIRDTTESTCVAALMKMYQQLVQAEK